MITTLVSVLAFALLFALYGVLRPRAACTGGCAGCRGESCPRFERRDSHV